MHVLAVWLSEFQQEAPSAAVFASILIVSIPTMTIFLVTQRTIMRGIAISVPKRLITPAVFALAACGNVGSDAGIVVIPPLAAAIFRQLGRNPIVGLLVGYVGATAGFTANLLPAGTDVLAMSLTNAATGNNPEINVLSNWYFMSASVLFWPCWAPSSPTATSHRGSARRREPKTWRSSA